MKKFYSISALLFIAVASHAQVFWTEGFGTGCNRGQLATAYTGTNGSWTLASTGTNGNTANTWYVSSSSANTGAGNCAATCMTTSATNATLHVSNVGIVIPSIYTVGADSGASYFSGGAAFCGFGYCGQTAKRIQSPTINCVGRTNVSATFIYLENGDGANDDAQFVFSPDAGVTWSSVNTLAKTTGSCGTLGQWTSITISLPQTADNNPLVQIGFTWVNNEDGVGTDPSFSVDDIDLASNPLGIASYSLSDINVFAAGNGLVKINTNGIGYKTTGVYNMLGEEVKFTQTDNMLRLENNISGIYIVNLDVNGVRVVRKVMIQ